MSQIKDILPAIQHDEFLISVKAEELRFLFLVFSDADF